MYTRIRSADFVTESQGKSAHYHDCHQILYIQSGRAEITIGAKAYTAAAGSVAIISRFEHHAVRIAEEGCRRFVLRISPDIALDEWSNLFSVLVNRPKNFSHVFTVGGYARSVERIAEELCWEQTHRESQRPERQDLLLKELLILISRCRPDLPSEKDDEKLTIVNRIKSEFENRYADEYTLEALSKKYAVSPYYLSHIFKNVTGVSVMNYLLSCRLAQSKRLLIKTDLPISEIVARCGFTDCSNYSRVFKKQAGVTPREFRRMYG